MKGKLAPLHLRRADSGLFRHLLGSVPWDKALEGRGAQESWFVLEGHLQAQEMVHPNEQEVGPKRREAHVDERGAPGQTQAQKGSLQRVEARTHPPPVSKTGDDLVTANMEKAERGTQRFFFPPFSLAITVLACLKSLNLKAGTGGTKSLPSWETIRFETA